MKPSPSAPPNPPWAGPGPPARRVRSGEQRALIAADSRCSAPAGAAPWPCPRGRRHTRSPALPGGSGGPSPAAAAAPRPHPAAPRLAMIIRPRRLTPGYFRLLQVRAEQGRGSPREPPGSPGMSLPALPTRPAGALPVCSPAQRGAPRWQPRCCPWGPISAARGTLKPPLRCPEGHEAAPVAFTSPSVMGTFRACPRALVPVGFGVLRAPLCSPCPHRCSWQRDVGLSRGGGC